MLEGISNLKFALYASCFSKYSIVAVSKMASSAKLVVSLLIRDSFFSK